MKMNVYEHKIGSGKKQIIASYTVIAGCERESALKQELNSHLVDSFEHINRRVTL